MRFLSAALVTKNQKKLKFRLLGGSLPLWPLKVAGAAADRNLASEL
jgi:hypothetical protein